MLNWIRNPKAPVSLWDGLVLDGAYAGLHPGTNRFVDGSGLENHGTLTNMDAATDWVWSDELSRQTTVFDQTSTNEVRLAQKLTPTTAVSVCGWVNISTDTGGNFGTLVAGDRGAYASDFWMGWDRTLTNPRGYLYLDGVVDYTVPQGAPTPGQWTHLAATWESERPARWYKNGLLHWTGTASVSGTITRSAGASAIGYSSSAYKLDGPCADVLCYVRAIAAEEISWLANRSNRLYVPDTRRAIWVPTPFSPAMMRRRRRMAGAR